MTSQPSRSTDTPFSPILLGIYIYKSFRRVSWEKLFMLNKKQNNKNMINWFKKNSPKAQQYRLGTVFIYYVL